MTEEEEIVISQIQIIEEQDIYEIQYIDYFAVFSNIAI